MNTTKEFITESVPESQEVVDARFKDIVTQMNAPDFYKKTEELRAYSAERSEIPTTRLGRIRAKLGKFATSAMDKLSFANANVNTTLLNGVGSVGDRIASYKENRAEKLEAMSPKQRARHKRLGRAAIIVGGALAIPVAATAYAYAAEIVTGGREDPTSQGFRNGLNGFQGIGGNNDKLTQYPAAMIPGIDSTTWNNSADIASDSIYNATKANGNGYDHLFGYSQGSGGTLMAAQRIAGENGGVLPDNIDVTMLGAPSTPGTGFFKDTKVQMAKPLFDMMGIDVDPGDAPAGTTYYGKPGDIWANGGSRNIITQTGQALGTAFGGTHGYSPAELQNPANIITDVNGVKVVHVADDLSGYGHAARANGLEWSDSAEQLVDAVAPEGIVGRPAPAPDMQAAFTAGSKVIEETAAFHGMPIDIPDAQLPAMPNPMDIAPAAPAGGTPPVLEQVQQVVEQFTQPAPAYDAYVPPVMEQVQQVVEQFTQQAPAPVAAPAAMPQMEQINTAINDAVQNSPFAQFLPR